MISHDVKGNEKKRKQNEMSTHMNEWMDGWMNGLSWIELTWMKWIGLNWMNWIELALNWIILNLCGLNRIALTWHETKFMTGVHEWMHKSMKWHETVE